MSTAALSTPTAARRTATLRRTLRVEWERTLAWTLIGAAPLALLWGWQHLAGTPFGAEEVAYLISGGLTAVVLLLGGVAALITADLRDEHYKLERLESVVWGGDSPAPEVGRWWAARLGCVVVVAVGFGAAGWARAAGTGRLSVALDGLALAALGPLLAAAGLAVHAVLARRAVVRRRNGLFTELRTALGLDTEPHTGSDARA